MNLACISTFKFLATAPCSHATSKVPIFGLLPEIVAPAKLFLIFKRFGLMVSILIFL